MSFLPSPRSAGGKGDGEKSGRDIEEGLVLL